MSYTLEKLVDYSTQISFRNHQYFDNAGNLTSEKKVKKDDHPSSNLSSYIFNLNVTIETGDETERNKSKVIFNECIENITAHLRNKISGFRSFFISRTEIERINHLISNIESQKFETLLQPSEEQFRIKAYRDLSERLKIKDAPSENEASAIKKISEALFTKHAGDYNHYRKEMKHFFKGGHMLFDENLKDQLKQCGAILRSSSHYDFGSMDHKKGGQVPSTEEFALGGNVTPHYEITGPQCKEILFGKVTLELDENDKPLFGRVASKGARNTRTYTFLQTEWTPDCTDWKKGDWWKHRVLSFGLYAARRLLGFAKPNVGPYGYGRPDTNPHVI